MSERTEDVRGTREDGAPTMKVNVPARAPTTPPDIGASTNAPEELSCTDEATLREVMGSIVEQSMKRRDLCVSELIDGRGEESIDPKADSTCWGSGRTVIIVSYSSLSQSLTLHVIIRSD